ncbi:MAG: FdhF/YdeP family oxidoreductase [Bacteroidetes bacterium]|nr:FdhF/YdeP family oxidoreductase [Bacteroidota bacterium]
MQNSSNLSFTEQFSLLTVDPVSGRVYPLPEQVLHLALAGALLFDASFNQLINDDWKQLTVLDTPETGALVMDEALWCLRLCEGAIPLQKALTLVAAHGKTLNRLVWDSLLTDGLLARKKKSLYPISDKQSLFSSDIQYFVKIHQAIRDAVLEDDVPDYQVPALVSLIVACGLTKYIFTFKEISRYQEKIDRLAGMESLGREIIRSVRSLETADLEKEAATLIGMIHDEPETFAGGMDAVLSSLSYLFKETGIRRGRKLISNLNQLDGFECPGCAWPNPDKNRSSFGFCENGAKNVSAEATTRLITPEFFRKWPVKDLLLTSGYWLEQQGRLTEPMILNKKATHYEPISWEGAFRVIAGELNALGHPDEAIFYGSGRTSNEAAFLYQLLARSFGTNNLPSSANLCHEPSGKALTLSLGFAKSSILLEDFSKAESIFLLGHNPGSNHPRMLSSLKEAVRKGCRIIAVNPMPEASLMGFADPKKAMSYLGKQTVLARLYLQPVINGDMALIRGIVKAILEKEDREGGILDHPFIRNHCSGFEAYRQTVMDTPWEELVTSSGVSKENILEAAGIYVHAERVIACWCLGIVHHRNAVETIQEIINLLLLRGNIGRPGTGLCPVRGHSNIQGMRTAGAGESIPESFLEALEKRFHIKVPHHPGMSIIPAIKSMAEGKTKVLFSLGGNLASSLPDTAYVEKALRNCRLTVMISTKLNRSHLITGKKALILPCLSRSEEDRQLGSIQSVSIEDALGKIGFSRGCLPPASSNIRSEVSIIAGMARAVLANHQQSDWMRFELDNQYIRTTIAETVPALHDLNKISPSTQGFYLENPLRDRIFNTTDSKAQFSNHPVNQVVPQEGELLLMTIRSHDQFNTSVFGLNDRYRGIRNERRVLFMNPEDMASRNISPEQPVDITSFYDQKERKLKGYYAIPYPVKQGCVAAYYPETNVLISINDTCESCETPAYKSVIVEVKKSV